MCLKYFHFLWLTELASANFPMWMYKKKDTFAMFLLWIPITASLLFAVLAVNEFTFLPLHSMSRLYDESIHYPTQPLSSTSMLFWSGFIVVAAFFIFVDECSRFSVLLYCSVLYLFVFNSLFYCTGVQNIVFYLIYLNTNGPYHLCLVQPSRFPTGIQSLVQTMKRLLLLLFFFI